MSWRISPSVSGWIAATCICLAGLGCGSGSTDQSVVVGSKNYTEQDILGEIVAVWIERKTNLTVDRRLHLGGTAVCHQAIINGDIDVYVEYTGTALTAVLGREPLNLPSATYDTVKAVYQRRLALTWTEPLGFENTFALIVRRETADSLGVTTISGLSEYAEDLRAGFVYEFFERPDGYRGLTKAYDLKFRGTPQTMELGLLYRALDRGKVDVIAANSTDGLIDALGLQILEDDRGYFPPYEAAPVVRSGVLEKHPQLRKALESLGGRLTAGEVRHLNRTVDQDQKSYRKVAAGWVARELSAATR